MDSSSSSAILGNCTMRQPSRMAWSGVLVGPVFGVRRSVGDFAVFDEGHAVDAGVQGSAAGLQVEQILIAVSPRSILRGSDANPLQ